MFHESQIERVKERIRFDLSFIHIYGSVKIYPCFYDDLLVSPTEYNGQYPCSKEYVDPKELLPFIHQCMTEPYTIRTNIQFESVPAGASNPLRIEEYIEVSKIFGLK